MKIVISILLFLTISLFADEIKPAFLQIKALGNNSYDVIWKVPVKRDNKPRDISVKFDKSVQNIQKTKSVKISRSYIQNWRIYKKGSLAGSQLQIVGLSSTNTEVLVRIIDENSNVTSLMLSPRKTKYTFSKVPVGTLDTVKAYTELGFEHILEGIDHLLFVTCLVIIASTFRKLFWTITGFTLAHSITLFLSALGIANVPIPPIEASIALSIIFLAIEIVKNNKNSLTYRYPVVVSSSFGLLHGFGFASALMEIGLPENERVVALLFFNVGVELGQLVFVAFLLSIAWIFKIIFKNNTNIEYTKIAGYVIGSIATMWLYQRVLIF
jgi:hydrogenase/urease accessory protein HupE